MKLVSIGRNKDTSFTLKLLGNCLDLGMFS